MNIDELRLETLCRLDCLKKPSLSDKKLKPPIARRFFVICKQMRECYFGLEEGFCIPQKTISSILFSAFLYL